MPSAVFDWDGDALIPIPVHRKRCDEQFVVGETYFMEAIEERSGKSHRQFFAALRDAWRNLPERFGMEPWAQSEKHLRAYALIRTGFFDAQTFPCSSVAEAKRWAANMRPLDEYSIVLAKGDIVERYTAKSQSMKAMGKDDFQRSKTAVLDFVADLIGVQPDQLGRDAA